ncbi:hypothetical protein Dxin01_00644 [Deinococcus xinjiangensis]|uniref:DUF4259 domain-containing protein n=1 Tax=Deinococcus xinjiangensis TaxID=457454 RepID=A0ABP9V8H4_9DEIO
MNVWGTGAFDNDSGKEFIDEVVQDGPYALREAFEVALDPDTDDLAAEEGHRALAAAEILVAVLGGDTSKITDAGLRAWVQGADAAQLAPLRPLAAEALDRVLGPQSELPDLWEDTEDARAWQAEVGRIRAQL